MDKLGKIRPAAAGYFREGYGKSTAFQQIDEQRRSFPKIDGQRPGADQREKVETALQREVKKGALRRCTHESLGGNLLRVAYLDDAARALVPVEPVPD